MKTRLFIVTMLALTVAGCERNIDILESDNNEGNIVTINATIAPETRVSYDGDTGGLAWEEGDQLLLFGFDNSDAYVGNSTFNYLSDNTFTGTPVPGADKYAAYYKVEGLEFIEEIRQVVDPDTFYYGQTQIGNGSTAHLKSKLFLGDHGPKPLTQSFTLSGRNCIIKFNITNIPADVGQLGQLIWMVENFEPYTPSPYRYVGYMALNVENVTFSPTERTLTAYLCFAPYKMKIIPNGKVRVSLLGEKSYRMDCGTITDGKNYNGGSYYTAFISDDNWGPIPNPLSFVAEYNVTQDGNAFVTSLTDCEGSGYFAFQDAVDNFTTKTIGGVAYHLPSREEWASIVSYSYSPYYVRFKSTSSYDNSEEGNGVVVQGEQFFSMFSDYRNTGSSNSISPCYALRYKGTDMLSAWKYEYISDGNNTHMKITSRNVSPTVTIDDIVNATFWTSGTENDVVRYFPASGVYFMNEYKYVGSQGLFWSSTEYSSSQPEVGYVMSFSTGGAGIHPRGENSSVRLFITPN